MLFREGFSNSFPSVSLQYHSKKSSPPDLGLSPAHLAALGIKNLPVDCAEFLRSSLKAVSASDKGEASKVSEDFQLSLHWKFECPECKRCCCCFSSVVRP